MTPPSNGSLTGPASSKWVTVPIAMATECQAECRAIVHEYTQRSATVCEPQTVAYGAEIRMAFDGRIGVVSQQLRAPYSQRLDKLVSHGAVTCRVANMRYLAIALLIILAAPPYPSAHRGHFPMTKKPKKSRPSKMPLYFSDDMPHDVLKAIGQKGGGR